MKILHYHADNGRFADNAFIADCNAQQQSLLYCGVIAHFQNGITERPIRDLQEQTRNSMLYTMNKWKRMILICLWPYAMRHANNVASKTSRKGEELSPLEKFSVCRSHQSCDISMHSVAPHTCWIMHCKVDKAHPNGNIAPDSGCTLVYHQAMPNQWHSCSTHAQATFHHSSMSSSTIFLRWYKKSPPTLTFPNWNGNISVVSQSRRDRPSQVSKE